MYDSELRWRRFYDGFARYYDLSIRAGALILGFDDRRERERMVRLLRLRPGMRVLEVSAGTGSNLPPIVHGTGTSGRIVALDLSRGMLGRCRRKTAVLEPLPALIEGEAAHLPFASGTFDAVLHFGGINEFSDRALAIREAMRVARPGARIVIGDEGLAPGKERTLRGKLLLRNRLYANRPPVDLIPREAREVRQTWFRNGGCYLIDFENP
jgi:ubiquinone/menaquinone biosynthesis C-methylase UbiE